MTDADVYSSNLQAARAVPPVSSAEKAVAIVGERAHAS